MTNLSTVLSIAEYIKHTGATVRQAGRTYNLPKSTVHKLMTITLPKYRPTLATEVKRIFAYHTKIRHLRGGAATQQKWKAIYGDAHNYKLLASDWELYDHALSMLVAERPEV